MIIILSGKAQSGKDTAASHIIEKLYPKAKIYSYATALKDIGASMFDIDPKLAYGTNEDKNSLTKIEWDNLPFHQDAIALLKFNLKAKDKIFLTIREFLIIFGTRICRRIYPNCWVNSVRNRIKTENPEIAIITDSRFPNELDAFLEDKDVVVIRFTRNLLNMQDESEMALDNYNFSKFKYNFIIDNKDMDVDSKNKQVESILQTIGTHK